MLADTDGDSGRSRELLGAMYAEASITQAWMPEVADIPMQNDEQVFCGNFDPPRLSRRATHALDKDGICMHGELCYGVVQELQKYCNEPEPHLPPYPEDKQELDAAFDLLKALAPVGGATLDNPAPPPPANHAAPQITEYGAQCVLHF